MIWGAVIAVVVVVVLAGMYNGLIRLRNEVRNAWSQVDVQLKRRHDLVPNLVNVVKGYMTHERETLEAITRARGEAMQAAGAARAPVATAAAAESALTQALGRLFVVVENYPQLKASANFLALQEELASTENKIAFSRQYYNDAVMRLNTRVESFPTNLVAGAFRFRRADFFELEDAAARSVPQASFP